MTPFRTIVVAADWSERSLEAFRVACSLAEETKTRVFVVHVVPPGTGDGAPPSLVPDASPLSVEKFRDRLRDVYAPSRPIDVFHEVAEGDPAAEILSMASRCGADLIVLGTHGRAGLRRLVMGSVAETVLRRGHCPVITLRSGDSAFLPTSGPIRTILCPTDFSEGADAACHLGRQLASRYGSRLLLLHVVPIEIIEGGYLPVDPEIFRGSLNKLRNDLDGPGLKFPVEAHLRNGNAAEEIVAVAKHERADLIVLGTHGRTGLGRILMGSVTVEVLRRAPGPVLAIKPVSPESSAPTNEWTSTAPIPG